jgi:cytosine/creatinine deaminase
MNTVVKPVRQNMDLLTSYDKQLVEAAMEYGGFYNAHAHLCRANTLEPRYLKHANITPIEASNFPLSAKQNMVGELHKGEAYTGKDLRLRISDELLREYALGTRRIDTNIDATPRLPEDGLLAINIALELKEEFKGRIDLRIAPTPIFGFKEDAEDPRPRWEVFKEAARMCDYLSLLPEKDDPATDGRIGFKRHVHRGLMLGLELGKEVQFHADQSNLPSERGTEQILDVLEGFEQPLMPNGEPWAWIVHMISPTSYFELRRRRLLHRLKEQNVGVIVCSAAGISMRQIRSILAPIHNSLACVLELMKMKIPIRLGTDNIADMFVPQGDGDMLTEVKMGGLATRIAPPHIWAKLATGTKLNSIDIATVGNILYQDRKACQAMNSSWKPAVE